MAAEVDFGDLELFEAFDHPEESLPKPVHTRFKDDDGNEEDENGVGDAELREQLRQYEEAIQQLRAENILPARWALSPRRGVDAVPWRVRAEIARGPEFASNFSRRTGGLRVWGSDCVNCPGPFPLISPLWGSVFWTRFAPPAHPASGRFLGLFQTVSAVRFSPLFGVI